MNDVRNVEKPITLDFRNNIVCASKVSRTYMGGEAGFYEKGVQLSGNGSVRCDGKRLASTSFDAGAIFADPMFVKAEGKPPDFHLQAGSPAKGSGDITVIPLVISNYDFEANVSIALTINRGAY
jgi:hypothetical protein